MGCGGGGGGVCDRMFPHRECLRTNRLCECAHSVELERESAARESCCELEALRCAALIACGDALDGVEQKEPKRRRAHREVLLQLGMRSLEWMLLLRQRRLRLRRGQFGRGPWRRLWDREGELRGAACLWGLLMPPPAYLYM